VEELGPAIAAAGSPGASRIRTNTVETVRKIVRMLWPMRRTR
jgi:hypothetical protein